MRFLKSCQNIQTLIYAQEDRPLKWPERISKYTHFLICASCLQVQSNVITLRQGLRRWRAYQGD